MAFQTMAVERYVRTLASPFSNERKRPGGFPVAIAACASEMPAVLGKGLPVLAERKGELPAPVRVMNVTLTSGKEFFVDGVRHELPLGVKNRITVRAFKRIAKAYAGGMVLVRKGSGYVRLRDHETIEIPENGNLDVKALPSFRLE